MPLFIHKIEPHYVSRSSSKKILESFEEINNLTLCNLIRQLGSLSCTAAYIFENLEKDTFNFQNRTNSISMRIQKLSKNVERIGSKGSQKLPYNLSTNLFLAPWTSVYEANEGLFTVDSRPPILQNIYDTKCDPLPQFHLIQHLHENNVNVDKFYSNPSIFFDIWKESMLIEATKIKNWKIQERKSLKSKREIMTPSKIVTRREIILEREIQAGNVKDWRSSIQSEDLSSIPLVTSAPPTPPPPLGTPEILESQLTPSTFRKNIPAPPPPPPIKDMQSTIQPEITKSEMKNMDAHFGRNELLKQIERGKKLKKTTSVARDKEKDSLELNNVADIISHVMDNLEFDENDVMWKEFIEEESEDEDWNP